MLTQQEAQECKTSGRRVTWRTNGRQYRGTVSSVSQTRALVRGASGSEEFRDWVSLKDLSLL